MCKKISRMFSSKKSTDKSLDQPQQSVREYIAKISELEVSLATAQKQNKNLLQTVNRNSSRIGELSEENESLKSEFQKQASLLRDKESQNNELRDKYLNLKEENEMLIGRSSNLVSKLVRFCQILRTMNYSTVDECISAIKYEIEQSVSDMGFSIIDAFEGEFNPQFHCIVDTKVTDDVLLDNHIAEVVRPGVWYKDKCLIPQDVIIYTIK